MPGNLNCIYSQHVYCYGSRYTDVITCCTDNFNLLNINRESESMCMWSLTHNELVYITYPQNVHSFKWSIYTHVLLDLLMYVAIECC